MENKTADGRRQCGYRCRYSTSLSVNSTGVVAVVTGDSDHSYRVECFRMSLTLLPLSETPVHGADLTNALQQYGGEPEHWLDLSAAISPYSWWAERGLMPAANSLRNLPQPVAELAQACVQ